MVLFKCCWYQEEKDSYGLTRVNFSKCHKTDPFVLSSQVQQVFYVEDAVEKNSHYVIKKLSRDWCDTENQNAMEEDMSNTHSHHMGIGGELEPEVVDVGWIRDDVPVIQLETEVEVEVPDPVPSH